jgi:peptidoglycan hydrolase CwlO-like protein
MKKTTYHNLLFLALIFSMISINMVAQTTEQDPKIEALLKEKRKINNDITINDVFKIQIFIGKLDESKKTLSEFKGRFKEIEGTMVYNNPTYKVWVGYFKTRIEAEKAMIDIKKEYPLALLIKPNK